MTKLVIPHSALRIPHLLAATCWSLLALTQLSSTVHAAELSLSIVRQSDGASTITVLPGTVVNYEIRGLLSSSTDNEGLAFWSANLEFQQDADIADNIMLWPDHNPMMNFAKDNGFSNPVDYTGTPTGQTLVQIGGGQNTIGNAASNAPFPVATVTSAVSRKANASGPDGVCDLPLTPAVKSETRQGGVTEMRIAFDTAPGNPAGSGTGITVEQKTCAAPTYASYSGSSTWTESVTTGNTLVLAFSPALENARTYRINLGALITATTGQSVEVRGLIADVDDNGDISGIDRSEIVDVWTSKGFSCKTDLDSSGATNGTDRSIWTSADTGSETCAP